MSTRSNDVQKAYELVQIWLGDDRTAAQAALREMLKGDALFFSLCVRSVQMQAKTKTNDTVRRLCDAIGNIQ